MKNLEVYYSLKELDSFVDQLKNENFEEFSFESMSKDGEYVLFSLIQKESSEKVSKLMKIMDEIPLPYIGNPYMDKAFFTVLCFVLKYKLVEVEIYGQCNIKVVSTNKGNYHNDVIISDSTYVADRKDLAFSPDLNSLNEVFKSIENVAFNNIKIDVPLRIFNSPTATKYKWSLRMLLNRFNFEKMG